MPPLAVFYMDCLAALTDWVGGQEKQRAMLVAQRNGNKVIESI